MQHAYTVDDLATATGPESFKQWTAETELTENVIHGFKAGIPAEFGVHRAYAQEIAQNDSDGESPSKKLAKHSELASKPNWPIKMYQLDSTNPRLAVSSGNVENLASNLHE